MYILTTLCIPSTIDEDFPSLCVETPENCNGTKRWGQEKSPSLQTVLGIFFSVFLRTRSPKDSLLLRRPQRIDIIGRSWKTKTLNISQFFFVFFPQAAYFPCSSFRETAVPSFDSHGCECRPKAKQKCQKEDLSSNFSFATHDLFRFVLSLIGKSLKFISQSSYSSAQYPEQPKEQKVTTKRTISLGGG